VGDNLEMNEAGLANFMKEIVDIDNAVQFGYDCIEGTIVYISRQTERQ
jgi:hypothetical protein